MKKIIFLIAILFSAIISNAQAVTTFAGSGVAGATNGTGTAAQFNNPTAICTDASHNVYVADSNNNVIRKISATGVVTTLAGSGVAGFADGTGTAAQFNNPSGICTDGSSIYVADTNNNRIRKITAAGVVTTLAGSTQGYVDGTGTGAKFNAPMGICYSGGIVYVADTSNNRIRKITSTGVVTTLAGSTQGYADGTGTTAQFNAPRGVTSTGSIIYLTDTNNNRIRKITLTGVVTTYAGSTQGYSDGSGTTAKFNNPTSISMDANGQLYVTDQNNNRIRKIYTYNPNLGSVATYSGSNQGYLDGNISNALFNAPTGIFIDSNVLYLTDSANNTIRKTTICDIYPEFQYYGGTNSFCATAGNIDVMEISGTYTNITFFSSTGLSLNSITGSISPSSSVPGYYGVTCTATPDGCPNVQYQVDVNIVSPPTAYISYTGSPYYTNVTTPQPVTLNGSGDYLGGSFSSQPSGLLINDFTGEIFPNNSIPGTYTVSYFVYNNGCQTNFTTQVVILNYSNLSITSSTTTAGLFDIITVDVQLSEATDVYSLYMKLKGNPAVSQYLDYSGYTAGTLLGTGGSVISTAPVATNGIYDFGITKVGSALGYTGGGLFYTFRFVTKNIPIPQGTSFCFYLDNISTYNSSGNPINLIYNQPQYCYTFTNQVNVWPGDLNNTKTVTTADLLPIGYFYNSQGPTRPNASIQWTAQPTALWGYNHSTASGDGYKAFADSNGDGVINNADQAAIGFNMNKIHAKTGFFAPSPAPPHFTAQQLAAAVGTLTVTPNTTIINGAVLPQTVTFTVSVNNIGGLNALYGTSVNLLFDETIFDLNTATIDYTGSIFGIAGTDCLVMNYNSSNMVSVGLTRYANAAINGQGLLFKVTIQTKTTLPNLTQTPVTAYVDAANNQAGDTLVIQDAPTTNLTIINNLGIDTFKADEFVLYPNPANDMIHLVMGTNTSELNNLKLKVITILGQTVEEMNIQNKTTDLSTKNWGTAGVYFVQITNAENTVVMTKKVIVSRK